MSKDDLHERRKAIAAPLSSDLREDYGFRSISIRVGDEVRIKSGDFKGSEGRVTDIDTDRRKIEIEGVEVATADETDVPTSIRPSNVEITGLEDDEKRDKIIERRSESGEKRREEPSEETERSESS